MDNTRYDNDPELVMPAGHMITVSGKMINLFKPSPTLITVEDIAHGLAHTCRWNGHTKSFYSVAEHCVRVVQLVPQEKKLTALFHDAEEAYWGDIISPLKKLLPTEIITKIVEFRQVIFDKFNVPPIDDEVNAADIAEMNWDHKHLIKSLKHVGWHPLKAKREFLFWAVKLLSYNSKLNKHD